MLCITCEGTDVIKGEGYVTTHDDEVESDEDSGTSGGQPECQFNDVAMSPSMEYIVQVSQSYRSNVFLIKSLC